jgi:hypothetical protein
VDKILSENPEEAPVDILQEAYEEFFWNARAKDFDPTLFRFLLGRLAQVKSEFPLSLEFPKHLSSHPEETDTILNYIEQINSQSALEGDTLEFLESGELVYSYQLYQILLWLGRVLENPSSGVIAVARRVAFDASQAPYVRAAARKLLADYGTQAHLERLQATYADTGSALEQSELICSLHRMEVGRRNAFLARTENDGDLQGRAVRLVRSGALG